MFCQSNCLYQITQKWKPSIKHLGQNHKQFSLTSFRVFISLLIGANYVGIIGNTCAMEVQLLLTVVDGINRNESIKSSKLRSFNLDQNSSLIDCANCRMRMILFYLCSIYFFIEPCRI